MKEDMKKDEWVPVKNRHFLDTEDWQVLICYYNGKELVWSEAHWDGACFSSDMIHMNNQHWVTHFKIPELP